MWIPEKQNGTFLFETSIGIIDDALPCGQTYFVKILSTVNFGRAAILLDFKDIESFKL